MTRTNRREFLRRAGALGAVGTIPKHAFGATQTTQGTSGPSRGPADREIWVGWLQRLATPVLEHLAAGTLTRMMPVETQPDRTDRRTVTHLEAFGRLMTGLAPWIELKPDDSPEGRLRARYGDLARKALRMATDPASPDFLNFHRGSQPLVDSAFLGHGRPRRHLRRPRVPDDLERRALRDARYRRGPERLTVTRGWACLLARWQPSTRSRPGATATMAGRTDSQRTASSSCHSGRNGDT